jgi:predicted dehydrogenase (TIGR03970 family)
LHSDVLIIGAGSAGCVVAERLSADERCQVTVAEAGPVASDPELRAMISEGSVLPIGSASPLVRRFETALTDRPRRVAHVVRGAVVGGSGAVNGGYFCRGLPGDFDGWGLPGWAWADVLPHFREIETDLDFDGSLHGRRGPIPVQRIREMARSAGEFVRRANDVGYHWIADLNGARDSTSAVAGVGAVPLNIVEGVRVGPDCAFLDPALKRPNLTLVDGTSIWRLRISAGRVIGVEGQGPEGLVTLSADRIVLCAGAIGTAQLLMLSGVGDSTVLTGAGIPVMVGAPVGMHCVDHPEWVIPTTWAPAPGHPVLEAILHTGDGVEIRPYSGGFVAMVGDRSIGRPDWPHAGVALMQPRSRGRVTVVSADPRVPLRIEHRYDSAPSDVVALRRGCELARELCPVTRPTAEPLWSTSQHLCATAPMGADSDERAVLDEQCRVRGVDGLWVIDGAALPAIPSRGPHATIVMLAHRAAEFVAAG